MIEGVSISLGGRDFTVPALNFKGIRAREEDIDRISKPASDESEAFGADRMGAVCRIVHTALVRNYPDVTLEQVEDWVDLNNVTYVIDAVLGQSGLKKNAGEEGSAPGEAPSPSTGTGSTPPSPSTPDGPGSTSTSA